MVVDERGTFRSQRRYPRLALVQPGIGVDGRRLMLRAPGMDALELAVDAASPPREVELFGARYRGVDQGDEAAGWLSEFLGAPSRLAGVPPDHERVTDGLTPGTSGYADSSAVHMLSRASLDGLNGRLADAGRLPLPMGRFRPNIVVDGWEDAHVEDELRNVRIGDAELGFAKLALRCVVTTVDQRTGAKAGPEPLRTLATYRRVPEGAVAFGSKFSVVRPGRIALGDEVIVDAWRDGAAVMEAAPGARK
jgi:uncharacterized protein YcbX